jgi:hypothetical protein
VEELSRVSWRLEDGPWQFGSRLYLVIDDRPVAALYRVPGSEVGVWSVEGASPEDRALLLAWAATQEDDWSDLRAALEAAPVEVAP